MTALELISQHKQIVSRGYYTNADGEKVKSLTLPDGMNVKGNTLKVGNYDLVTVKMNGDSRETTYHNTATFNTLVNKAVANYNNMVKRNANGLYSADDICVDSYGDGNITLVEKFKLPAVAQAITLEQLLLMGKQA
jgi:hypothetical protein